MGFELDKHDLFRVAIPGAIFLLVLFSFFVFNAGLSSIGNIGLIMTILITLPIGYLIQNVYRAWHVLKEQKEWYKCEADITKSVLEKEKSNDKTKKAYDLAIDSSDKKLSWFIEICLHIKSNESIRERAYTLISRAHSAGASIVAIILAFPIAYVFWVKSEHNPTPDFVFCNLLICVLWIILIISLFLARENAIDGYQELISHFIKIRQKTLEGILLGDIDPFCEK